MTEDDFIQLVQKAEQDAEQNIKSYRSKLLLFAGLGYAVIFLMVKKFWLAKKVLQYYPQHPVYVFAFTPKGSYLSYEGVQKAVAESLQYDGDVFVVVKGDDYRKLAKKVIKSGIQVN